MQQDEMISSAADLRSTPTAFKPSPLQPRTARDMPFLFSPPKPFLSPNQRKPNSEKNIGFGTDSKVGDEGKDKRWKNILFTIEENHYFRKNYNPLSPKHSKNRPPLSKSPIFAEVEGSETARERRVVFTQALIKQEGGKSSKRDGLCAKPIIRNSGQDNLSNSSKSLSVQQSLISQFRSMSRERIRPDNNHQKYVQIMNHLKQSQRPAQSNRAKQKNQGKGEQYTDPIFPPVHSSIFLLNGRSAFPVNSDISWKRLSDLAHDQEPKIFKPNSELRIVWLPNSYACQFMVIALNALKHSPTVLQRIFEDQVYNTHGLYLLRIFQQQSWKSVILDDHLPVCKNQQGHFIPAFIDIQAEAGSYSEIWPYLLEKAYANYYSAYQMLRFGNALDFLSQMMGLAPLQFSLKKRSEKELIALRYKLEVVDSVALGVLQQGNFIVVRSDSKDFTLKYSTSPFFHQLPFNIVTLGRLRRIYIYSPKTFSTLTASTIGKYSPSLSNLDRAQCSLRKLIVGQGGQWIVSIQQKESRFFWRSSLTYSYMWVRVLLVQREYDGYRWIEGGYANSKSIRFHCALTAGQYYLLIMPEWHQTQNYELSLLMWGEHPLVIERQNAAHCDQMIELACMDLAQRKGKINQITSTLCSYNYVCPRTALIIENINNEKLKQTVRITRSIARIPCSVQLLPINRLFWQDRGVFRTEIQVDIPKLSNYTIVLKMRGGVDRKLLKFFANESERA